MSEEPVWSVSEVNAAVRDLIENSLMPFWIRAEVGTLTIHRSGHVYLTLKDHACQLRAAYFGGAALCRSMNLAVGMSLEVFGKLTVYPPRGEYQFTIRTLRPVGQGELQRRFEELKRKLAAEGLFDEGRKKPIPQLPRRIGVITSADGAALRDFLQIVERRFPNLFIRIYPAAVQGVNAAAEVAAGIAFFNRTAGADVLVVTRGGGSMEDLWPFNEERLARAVAASRIPVISAVGHEIDFTICDFAADLRVPTPSAAAELVIGRREEFLTRLQRFEKDLKQALRWCWQQAQQRLKRAEQSYVFREPVHLVQIKMQQVDERYERLQRVLGRRLEMNLRRLTAAENRLEAMDPQAVLKRGYALLEHGSGGLITRPEMVRPGETVRAQLADFALDMTVERIITT